MRKGVCVKGRAAGGRLPVGAKGQAPDPPEARPLGGVGRPAWMGYLSERMHAPWQFAQSQPQQRLPLRRSEIIFQAIAAMTMSSAPPMIQVAMGILPSNFV